ncbi:hypothetical protein [Aureimonas sp. AU12]|uniref:hypothetical protein n=1 Tax=Aureimonas sp. AU12 TaxID=1638161 RepID=UPI0007828ED0|nr:hypothetical protein [Aureimonas sp. AU12]
MSNLVAAILAFLFFAPLAFVYGRQVAGAQHRAARGAGHADARGLAAIAWPKLVVPLILGPAMLYRLSGVSPATAGLVESNTIRTALSLLWFAGSIAAILFFVTIPFVLGRLFGVGAAFAGRFTEIRDEPLRFGTRGYRRSGGAGEGTGEAGSGKGRDDGGGDGGGGGGD